MTVPFFPALPSHSLLALFVSNLFLSLIVALLLTRRKTTGLFCVFLLFGLGLLVTAPLGYLVTVLYRRQQQKAAERNRCISNPVTVQDYLLRLKLYNQTGMLSKAEYEAEKQRILESTPRPLGQASILPNDSILSPAIFILPEVV